MQLTLSTPRHEKFPDNMQILIEDVRNRELHDICMTLYNYLFQTQKRSFEHLKKAQEIELEAYMTLDMYSKRNLEITASMMRKKNSGVCYGSLIAQ